MNRPINIAASKARGQVMETWLRLKASRFAEAYQFEKLCHRIVLQKPMPAVSNTGRTCAAGSSIAFAEFGDVGCGGR